MGIAYLIIGKLQSDAKHGVDVYYGVCHSLQAAEQLCLEAEEHDTSGRYYLWFPIPDFSN